MKPKATSTRNEALQKFIAGRHGVDGISVGSSGKGSCCTGTDAKWFKKGNSGKVQGCGSWCKQIRQPVSVLCCLWKVFQCLC